MCIDWTRPIRAYTMAASNQTRKHLEYLLVLDFEGTCGDAIKRQEREIIEFPTLLYNLRTNEVQAQFHEYVKPVLNPTLTEFCTELTGITQVRLISECVYAS